MIKRILFLIVPTLALLIVFTIAAQTLIHFDTAGRIFDEAKDVPAAQAVIIPGAAILANRDLSPVFRDRVNTALQLYSSGKVSKILVSGDNSTVEHNEVNPVRNYLLERGVPGEDIFLDHAGFDTYSTMYRAREIFRVESAIIATQEFHLPRAIFLARNLGMTAYGLKADNDSYSLRPRNYVREFFAKEKAALDIMTNRRPKYLGEQIPITGDGRSYP